MTSGYYCAIFSFCGGGKKKRTKKQRHFMGYHRYPSNNAKTIIVSDSPARGMKLFTFRCVNTEASADCNE